MNSDKTPFDDQFEAAEREVRRQQAAARLSRQSKFSFSTASQAKPQVFKITLEVAQSIVSSVVNLSALPIKRSCK